MDRRAGVGLALIAVALTAAAAPLRFETVFATDGEPATLHFRATFASRGGSHLVEVWRDHDLRLKRLTDAGLVTYVVHSPGDPEFRMTMVDPAKHVVTTIDRTNLYRLGNFTDWFDLGHGLRHPKGPYQLAVGRAPRAGPPPVAACTWFDLTAAGRTSHICWSRDSRLPLVIAAADGAPVWRVTTIDRVVPADAFRIADHGYVRVDANRDLDRD